MHNSSTVTVATHTFAHPSIMYDRTEDRVVSRNRTQSRLQFQPVFGADGRIHGVEALSPPRPGATSAQIDKHDRWVLATGCRQVAAWLALQPDLCLEVNVPPSRLADPKFAPNVAGALKRSGLPGPQLILELLENEEIDFINPVVTRTLARLLALGVQIAGDDFGTECVTSIEQARSRIAGNGTFAWRELFTTMKIDRSLVTEEANRHRLAALLRLAARYGLTVIVEGVEALEHLVKVMLLRPGVQLLWQGWYSDGEKLPPREFETRWLPQPALI